MPNGTVVRDLAGKGLAGDSVGVDPLSRAGIVLCLVLGSAPRAQSPRFELRAEPSPRLHFADGGEPLVGETSAGGVAPLTFRADARLGVTSSRSFTLRASLRTSDAGFATALMCREGSAVHYSLVMGRTPGRISFEAWTWASDRALSPTRVDDGRWHAIEVAFDADARSMAMAVDGAWTDVVPVTATFAGSKAPALRLGDNLDPNVQQRFAGEVRACSLADGLSPAATEVFRREASLRVLDAAAPRQALSAWLVDQRRARPPVAASAAAWTARASHLRAALQDAIGLWPPPYAPSAPRALAGAPSPLSGAATSAATAFTTYAPTLPLDVREGGTLVRERHRVTRVYWQTFAGYFASGWLYVPNPAPITRGPAILCPHGHWADGARHPVVQARCIALAQQGYVVLAVDSVHVYDLRVALSPLSAMTWNNLRGLELLRARDDVDPSRIGCTGASGGGQQTYYLTGLDSGLAAAVPAVMACHLEDILLEDNVHCACNHTPHLLRAADMPEMAAAFAPKPQLFLTVTGDWTHRFHEHGFPAVRAVYDLCGAADAVTVRQWQKGHDYDQEMRETMYAFFARTLQGRAIEPKEPAGGMPTESGNDLLALDRTDVPQDPAAIVAEFHQRLRAPRGGEPAMVVARLRRLFEADAGEIPSTSARTVGSFEADGLRGSTWAITSERGIELPAILLRAETDAKDAPVAIVVADGDGKRGVLARQRPWLDALRQARVHVLLADLRYAGELDQGRAWRDRYGATFGLDEGVLAVRDLRRVVDVLPALGLPSARVGVVGFGGAGAVAILAATLDARLHAVAAPKLGPNYRDADRAPKISRILLHGDLDDALAACAPRAVLRDDAATPDHFAAALGR